MRPSAILPCIENFRIPPSGFPDFPTFAPVKKPDKFVMGKPSQNYGVSQKYGVTQFYLQPDIRETPRFKRPQ